MEITDAQIGRIRHLNDLLRCRGVGGEVMVTAGLDALGTATVIRILLEVAAFTDFNGDNDPHGEHDCGVLSVNGLSIAFKIDYFDRTLTYRSADPADPSLTVRIMTVMLSHEY